MKRDEKKEKSKRRATVVYSSLFTSISFILKRTMNDDVYKIDYNKKSTLAFTRTYAQSCSGRCLKTPDIYINYKFQVRVGNTDNYESYYSYSYICLYFE